ncbi:cytoplasmic dynein 2 light intermediate chain 1-like [Mya arenaria]|uniref:cytoplasmic dynein 2 light intermediate chain 1-like n=1 Tax=Mya arenaria TaxID=6604 RepID=UPI0022E63B2E|nr:cytoplasmic dynein 2 light intermediate chain 1-like [Mya arenaria]
MTTLWDLAIEQAGKDQDDGKNAEEKNLFIVGAKNSGKTSIILRFLERNEAPKPTVALEYTYARRSKGHNMAKDIGHIWELGGGTWLSKLMDIPLNADTLENGAVMICVDLSKPEEIWFTLESLLASSRARIEAAIADARQDNPGIREALQKRALARVGEDHADRNMLDPFPVPLVIVGTKYDLFQDMDSEKRKVICKSLRFVAHTNGAVLQFFSTKIEQLVQKARAVITNHLFGTIPSKVLQTEYNKPLMVPVGLDSLQAIGNVPLSDKDVGRVNARNPVDLWKHCFTSYFPQTNTDNPSKVEDPSKDPKYAEPAIDTLRAQKEEELERYRRQSERRSQKTRYDDVAA